MELKALKAFANPRIERVTRNGEEVENHGGAVQPGDTFDAGDALYARDLIRNGLAEGEVSDDEAEAVELTPHYAVSEGQLAANRAKRSGGKVDPLAGNVTSASGRAPAASTGGTVARTVQAGAPAPAKPTPSV